MAVEDQRNLRPELPVYEVAADVKLVVVLVEIANVSKRLPLSKRTAILSQIHRVKRAADRIDITRQLSLVKIVVPPMDGEKRERRVPRIALPALRLGAAPYFGAALPFGAAFLFCIGFSFGGVFRLVGAFLFCIGFFFGTAFRLVGAFLFCIGFSFDGAFPLCAALPLDAGAGVLSW